GVNSQDVVPSGRAGPAAGHLARRAAGRRCLPIRGMVPPRAREVSVRRHPPSVWLDWEPLQPGEGTLPAGGDERGSAPGEVSSCLEICDRATSYGQEITLRGPAGACLPGKPT